MLSFKSKPDFSLNGPRRFDVTMCGNVLGGARFKMGKVGGSMVDEPRVRDQLRWDLVQRGIDPDDSRIERLSLDQLFAWTSQEREMFREQERAWWHAHVPIDVIDVIAAATERYALGGVPEFPFVSRPVDYGTYSQYPEVPIEYRRRLYERGQLLEADVESRHHLLLAAIKVELEFDRALDPESQSRLLHMSHELRSNRPAAESLMESRWGTLPPSRGHEYDAMPFLIAERCIAYTYRQRNDDPAALEQAIKFCSAMIQRSPEFIAMFRELGQPLPAHKGFQQLAIIKDKQGDHRQALNLSKQAKEEGWEGDWDKRIERYQRRAEKSVKP